jgi:flagellar basal body P-ring formation protein FlgA
VSVGAQHWRTMPVWFAVRAWRPVWVAREPVAAGQATSQGFFTVEQREITALPSPPWPAGQGLEGLRLRRAVDAGAVLTAAQVELLPAVARNQPVRVQVNAGLVALQAAGVALADARIGERVRVLNPASRETFAARVVADGLVVPEER